MLWLQGRPKVILLQRKSPPTFPALPAQPELSVWGRGASRGVLSLVSVWCVCVRTGSFGSAWLYCNHFYQTVSGVLGTGSEDIRWVYGWLGAVAGEAAGMERGRACARLVGIGCLADVAAPCSYMASSKVSFGVFVFWGLSLCSTCC